jgi:hypothetical protein
MTDSNFEVEGDALDSVIAIFEKKGKEMSESH